MGKIDFETRHYEDGSLNRFEANDFVEAVVTSAFPVTQDENGISSMDYDPLSKLMGIKMNIIKFYGNVDLESIGIDELYTLASDIDVDEFVDENDINKVQFKDMLTAIDDKCDYIKQQLIASAIDIKLDSKDVNFKVEGVDDLVESVVALAPALEYINEVFAETYADGSMKEVAEKYGVQDALVEQSTEEETEDATEAATEAAEDSDVAYIQDKGSLIVGITDFEPMDYKDENGDWIGFDADMAGVVAEKLGVDVEFVEIDWDNKIMELDSKNIDMVWNGMTLTDEVTNSMECTNAYCNNAQVVVVPAE